MSDDAFTNRSPAAPFMALSGSAFSDGPRDLATGIGWIKTSPDVGDDHTPAGADIFEVLHPILDRGKETMVPGEDLDRDSIYLINKAKILFLKP